MQTKSKYESVASAPHKQANSSDLYMSNFPNIYIGSNQIPIYLYTRSHASFDKLWWKKLDIYFVNQCIIIRRRHCWVLVSSHRIQSLHMHISCMWFSKTGNHTYMMRVYIFVDHTKLSIASISLRIKTIWTISRILVYVAARFKGSLLWLRGVHSSIIFVLYCLWLRL